MLSILLLAAITNITGVVTFDRADIPFYFVREKNGVQWRVLADRKNPAVTGDVVFVSGKKEDSVKRRLYDTSLRVVRKARAEEIVPPQQIAVKEIFKGLMPYGNPDMYGRQMQTEGVLRDINRRMKVTQLLVGEENYNIQVELPVAIDETLPQWMVPGAIVKVTGALAYTSLENYYENKFGRIENVELIPRTKNDVEIVEYAPFWNVHRLVALLCGLALLFAGAFVWAVTLRLAVVKRTKELAESIRMNETARIEEDAVRRERLRLAADLHDGFQQYLAGAMFRLKAAMNYLPKDAENSRLQLLKVKEAIEHTQSGLRSTLWAMNEESEGPESIMALFSFASRRMPHWADKVDIKSIGEERKVARRMAGTLLLILQEAVGNALRHGQAEHVRVRLEFLKNTLVMSVVDDGAGFDVEEVEGSVGHYGLGTMRRRAEDLNGTLALWSKKTLGTKITVSIPLDLN
jgi:signal transduction histidine kinase